MTYSIQLRTSARKELALLERPWREKVAAKIDALGTEPRPHGSEKLAGTTRAYRIRVGDYRIVYEIFDDVLVVLIIRIGHRREVYR